LLSPNLSALPDPGLVAKWTDQPGVAPGVNRQHPRTDGRGDVHGPAVHTDDKVGGAKKPNHLSDGGSIEQIYGVAGQLPLHLADPCQDGCQRPHPLAKLGDMFGRHGFPFASRKRVQNNKGLVAKGCIQGVARRKWKDGPFHLRESETFKDSQVTQNSMLTADYWDHLVV
jgi:hypothetical protein